MKISVERDSLLAQLQTVSRVASTRSAIQALSGVELVAAQDGCELRATDMEVGLRVPLAAEVSRVAERLRGHRFTALENPGCGHCDLKGCCPIVADGRQVTT